MQDHPNKMALLTGVARFLAADLASNIEDRDLRFRTRIAAYLVQQVALELAFDEQQDAAEMKRLAALLGDDEPSPDAPTSARHEQLRAMNARLVERIRAGDVDEALFDHVKKTLEEKLAVVQPRFDTRLEVE